jgi:F0F1-type ATP synthase membrane subunit c/vacuolar-type H+-ATPase subunit K
MPINYTGTTRNYSELEEIQSELYQDSKTLREAVIDIEDGHKSGTDVYESKVEVAMTALNTGEVAATGDIDLNVQKTPVALVAFNYEDRINDNSLKGTRFEKSMKAGAFNTVSDEFDRKVLIEITPAIGADIENKLWNGATAATKVAVAALTPGAGQGSITAAAQTAVAAMPTTLFDSLVVRTLYNDSQSKTVPGAGLGDYIKVTGTTVTSANIAAQTGLLYLGAPSKVTDSPDAEFFMPLSFKAMIKAANNSVGAASNQNFVIEGAGASEKIYYNGHKINFHPLAANFMIFTLPKYLKVLMDSKGDLSSLQVDRVANGAMQRYIKNTQAMSTWVTNQRYITLYGG